MRDEHSEKAQQCPKNVVSPSSSHLALTQKYFLSLFLLLLFQNVVANLVEFPLVGKLLLWVQLEPVEASGWKRHLQGAKSRAW